jgi:hypothetical protein
MDLDNKKPNNPQPPQTNTTSPVPPSAETPQQVPVEAEPPTAPMTPSSFDAQSPTPQMPTPMAIGSAKKSKKKLFIIIAIILVVIIGGVAAVFAFWYQNPDKMVADGIVQTLQAKTTSYKGMISVDSSTFKVKVDLDGAYDAGAQNVNADITLSQGSVDYKLKGSVLIDANTDIYVKVANLEAVVAPLRTLFPEESQSAFDSTVEKLDDKWVKIDAAELATYNLGVSKIQGCTSNVVQQTENNMPLIKEIEDTYKKYPFITASEKLGDKDGSTGFVLATDREKAKSFAVALKETQSYKTLHDCDKSFTIDENKFFAGTDSDVTTRTELWVNTWTHQITTLSMTGKSDKNASTTTVMLNPTFNTAVSIKAPSDAITLRDLQTELETLQQSMIQLQQAQSTQLEA